MHEYWNDIHWLTRYGIVCYGFPKESFGWTHCVLWTPNYQVEELWRNYVLWTTV